MNQQAFQDLFPELLSHCFGCGRNNEQGLQIKSYWDGEEAICNFTPKKYHLAGSGVLAGGIISTIIDCHCVCTAMAAFSKSEGRTLESKPFVPYAGGFIKIKFMKPISISKPVVFRAKIEEMKGRKTSLTCSVYSGKSVCCEGEVIAIQAQEPFWIK